MSHSNSPFLIPHRAFFSSVSLRLLSRRLVDQKQFINESVFYDIQLSQFSCGSSSCLPVERPTASTLFVPCKSSGFFALMQ